MFSFAVLVLVVANVVCAQVSTATIVNVGFPAETYQGGQVIGTGADGTTFIISGTDILENPYTATVVQDATHMSKASSWDTEVAEPPYGLPPYELRCGISQNTAICTETIQQYSTTYAVRISATRILVSPGPTASSSMRTGTPSKILLLMIPAFLMVLSVF